MSNFDFILSGKNTIKLESRAIADLESRVDGNFVHACELILATPGRVIVVGVGKSGHIGSKISSTLASTGTPAYFVHPGEASHGDFGMITANDIMIAISNSGMSSEIINILPLVKRLGVKLISLTGNADSTLAKMADVNIDVSVSEEACPHNLAPTSSTTATLAMGDALAIALLEAKGFSAEDFAFSHPGGNLGKRLLLKVSDVMHAGTEIPFTHTDAMLVDALTEISSKKLGMTIIADDNKQLLGIFTDGDLRRCIQKGMDIQSVHIKDVMTASPKTTTDSAMAAEALNIMEKHRITSLVVENAEKEILGVLHMHDLLRAGIA